MLKFGKKARRSHKSRRFKRRSNKYVSSRGLRAFDVGLGKKKLTAHKRRAFKRNLWNATDVQQKFRSTLIASVGTVAPIGLINANIDILDSLDQTNPFWTVAGGLKSTTFNVAPLVVTPQQVFVRGGEIKLSIATLPTAQDNVRVRVQLVYMKQQTRNYLDTNAVAPASEWSLDRVATWPKAYNQMLYEEPDYDEYYYRPVMDKEVILKPGDGLEYVHRLKSKRVDTAEFTRGYQMFPRWVIYTSQQTAAAIDTSEMLFTTNTFNLHFCITD